jgi:hypothetical protein
MVRADCERCHAFPLANQEWGGYRVLLALGVLRIAPRAAVALTPAELDISAIKGSVEDTKAHIDHVDARRPVIAIPYRGRYAVIDGNHRAAKQLKRGAAVKAYLLTAKEAEGIRDESL